METRDSEWGIDKIDAVENWALQKSERPSPEIMALLAIYFPVIVYNEKGRELDELEAQLDDIYYPNQ